MKLGKITILFLHGLIFVITLLILEIFLTSSHFNSLLSLILFFSITTLIYGLILWNFLKKCNEKNTVEAFINSLALFLSIVIELVFLRTIYSIIVGSFDAKVIVAALMSINTIIPALLTVLIPFLYAHQK